MPETNKDIDVLSFEPPDGTGEPATSGFLGLGGLRLLGRKSASAA
jgi:hypothetical protein